MTTMRTLIVLAAIAPMMASVPAQGAQTYMKSSSLGYATTPPRAWQDQDPAAALYKSARSALTDGDNKRAASLFEQIISKHPRSTYKQDAYYWAAFAHYREENYRRAESLLVLQRKQHPKAATAGDAATLLVRVRGEMAKAGEAGPAGELTIAAGGVAKGPCTNVDTKVEVMNNFLHMNSEQAIPMLKQVLARRDRSCVELRRKAVFLVSQKSGSEVEEILLGAARSDPDKEVREQAVFWLSQVGSERAVGYLEDILKTSNDRDIQDKAVFALSQHQSPRAAQIIRDYAANQSAPVEIREKAIFWLGQRGGTQAFLRTLYAQEKNSELKEKIIFSLSQQPGNESFLMDIATNAREDIDMRKKALFWAGQSGNTSLAELTGLYERMNDKEMKDQLIFVYSQRSEKGAVDKMMQIARTEPDRDLRKKAIFWLSQSNDPRVAEFLMQMIND